MYKNKKILFGNNILKIIQNKIKKKILIYKKIYNTYPTIIIIYIGNNLPTIIYIKKKCIHLKYVGIKYKIFHFNNNISNIFLINFIKKINNNKNIDCIFLQLPLPKHLDTIKIINSISPYKDVDGLTYTNIGKLSQKIPYIIPCTVLSVITLLKYYNIHINGLNTVIIGTSNLVGKPLIMELINHNCTITIINKKSKNYDKYIRNADLLISAVGKYNIFPTSWLKKQSIIIDIGININKNGLIRGDINFIKALKIVKYITPVPGGIGPITIAMLLNNIIKIYLYKHTNKNINQNYFYNHLF